MLAEIFGKEILLKQFACNTLSGQGELIPPSVNLFVKVTKGCNAHCAFCSNANTIAPVSKFNIGKLLDIIWELKSKNIIVNRINITGGEPSTVSSLVNKILDNLSEDDLRNIHTHLNTNGLLPSSQDLMRNPRWDSISMSLHHYDLNKLSELYGVAINKNAFRFKGINKQILNVSCNLIKGYIDNSIEVKKMMDFVIYLGIYRLGFVSLMKVNEYCKRNFVDFDDIHFDKIPHMYFTGSMNRGVNCKCSNYLYNNGEKILEIYMRNYSNPNYCESSLVYDGEYLRQGFYANNIIY